MKNKKKEMSKEFKIVRLGDLGQVITGSTPKTSIAANYESEDISFYKPSDLTNDVDILNSSEYKVSMYAYDNSRKLPKGSVLVSCIGIIGKVGILNEDAISNQQINAIVPNENVNSNYIAYSILANRFKIQSIANAPVVPIINKTAFSDIKILLPYYEKQQEIAAILDKASELVKKCKTQLIELDTLAESIFYDMFGDPITNEKGWDIKAISTVAEVKGRVGWKGYKKSDLRKSGALVLGATHINKVGEITLDNPVFISDEKYEESPEIIVNTNDLIIVQRGNTIGKVGLVNLNIDRATINPCVLIIRPLKADAKFLLYALKGEKTQNVFLTLNNGAAQPMLTQKQIKMFNIILPPLQLQQQFAERIEKIEQQKKKVKLAINESEDLFQRLMQDMFNPECHNL